MSLVAQIELLTVPQEFARLCNAVLAAQHGDLYLPIDDDRPDRGNDGYLKSERRLFAAHCFKRVQNQGIESAIRHKMVGDLGKAIALKREGIWDIDSWTFLSNYRVPEEVAARLVEIGREAGVEVSWRGPEELAAEIQQHSHILEQFPQLHATKIDAQLGAIQGALDVLASADEADKQDVEPPTRTPRTEEEQHQLLRSRPPGWEYLLFASVLFLGLRRLEAKWRDQELRLPRGPREYLDSQQTTKRLSRSFGELSAIWEPMNRLFDPAAQERAFGAPGEPGDPVLIEHFAGWIVDAYENMLDWAAALRNLDVPEPLETAVELAAQHVTQPTSDVRRFVAEAVREADRIPEHVASGSKDELLLETTLQLTVDDQILSQFKRELKDATEAIARE